MTKLFTDAEIAASIAPPPRCDWYIVIATWDGYWRMPSEFHGQRWATIADAEKASERLSGGWSNIRIVRIPGEGT